MKSAVRKIHRWKRVIAWILTVAMVAGNISQLGVSTAYAAETNGLSMAGTISVMVQERDIQEVLSAAEEERPVFDEEEIPFKGAKKRCGARNGRGAAGGRDPDQTGKG